jgi:hypothetical protein
MLVGVGLITLYGWYRIIKGIREKKYAPPFSSQTYTS